MSLNPLQAKRAEDGHAVTDWIIARRRGRRARREVYVPPVLIDVNASGGPISVIVKGPSVFTAPKPVAPPRVSAAADLGLLVTLSRGATPSSTPGPPT